VCAILGSTFNGEFEDVHAIHDMVVELNETNGWQVPVHVDAASGGFIAPFIHPELEWDFRLPNVKSINTSGHKFGLVYAGIGWALWRQAEDLPADLGFHVNYLGGDQTSFTLNFSKGAGNVIAQYYNILRFGFNGYKAIMETSMETAACLRSALVETGLFDIVDKQNMPLVAFALKDASRYTCFDIQDKVRNRGWIVPAYTCPKSAQDLVIMRVVVKQNFAVHMADMLVNDILKAVAILETHHKLIQTAVKPEISPKKAKKHFSDIVRVINSNVMHQNSGKRTHGVC
jgi:glutamate decarboxylase